MGSAAARRAAPPDPSSPSRLFPTSTAPPQSVSTSNTAGHVAAARHGHGHGAAPPPPMALTSATTAAAAAATASSPSRLIRRLPSSSSPPPPSLLSLAARPGARSSPRACSYHRFVVRWEGRARALVGGFSDAGASESDDDDEDALRGGQREDEDAVEPAAAAAAPERWDVLGLGQAMVDFSGMVDDEFLERLGIEKGTRKVVNHEERGRVLRAMDGCSYKAAAGGSLSNSLVALARLGSSRSAGYPELKIAMAGSVGSDPLGSFYRAKLGRANVHFLSKPVKDGTTGTVIVLTTPDAQRTMLAYQGTSSTLSYDSDLADLVSKSNVLIVEGYLFELPHTIEAIKQACEDAHKNGALIAVTASDVSCIKRCYSDFWDIVGNYADILFANANEARAFWELPSTDSPMSATRYLSHSVPIVSVTDGVHGSYIGVKGEAIYIPPSPCLPVDTCGAGDAYASGILYGILRGASDLKGIGLLASQVAAVVVGQQGTRLRVQDADRLAESFAHHLDSLEFCSDV